MIATLSYSSRVVTVAFSLNIDLSSVSLRHRCGYQKSPETIDYFPVVKQHEMNITFWLSLTQATVPPVTNTASYSVHSVALLFYTETACS